jgi:hypothetical protein
MANDNTISTPQFTRGKSDIYDGQPWSEQAITDLRDALANDHTIEEAAAYLCRSGTIDDVRRKAMELGLIH